MEVGIWNAELEKRRYFDLKRLSEAIPQIFNLQHSIPACPGRD
jgi:hypothetical protein